MGKLNGGREITNKIYYNFTVIGTKSYYYQNVGDPVAFQGCMSCGGAGQIKDKCKDISYPIYGTLYCQMIAYFENNSPTYGDSGSPVFYFAGTPDFVRIYGIYWGLEPSKHYYSPIDGVITDLGNLSVTYSD